MTITQSSTRLVAFVAGVAVAVSLIAGAFAAAPAQAAALTQSQISSIISLLQSFGADAQTIANVQASLNGQATSGTGGTTTGGTAACSVSWTQDLQQGSTGSAVKSLQQILNMWPDTMVAASGAGSPGNETTTFGPATKAAVIKFQTKYNVTPIAGYFGPKSRAQLASLCSGSSTGGGTTPTGPGLTISAGAQPANALAPQGATRVPFTTFTLTNNSGVVQTVTGVTVQRVGLGVDANFSGIVLVDATNNLQIGTAKTLNSNHQAVIGDTFTINPGQTMTLTVAGNIQTQANLSGTSGQIVSLQVVAVNTSAPVSGSLPINGASHTINSTLTLGSLSTTTSSYDPGADGHKSIGDTAVKFSGIRFTASSAEDLKFYSIRWRNTGTGSASDVSNVMTFVNGTSYPAVLDATGKYYTSTFPGGITIAKGNSVDVYVQGDITGSNAASRTIKFDIDKVTDVYFVGQNYGYGVAPEGTYTPWFSGHILTVDAGTATSISKANEVAAQNIALNVPNQPLGGFVTDFRGEAVSVQQMVFDVSTTSTLGPITSASIVDENGAVVAGPVDENNVTSGKLTFTDTVTFPVGRHVYTIKGKVASGALNGTTIQLTTDPSAQWSNITGQTSGNSIQLTGQGSFSMNAMTVQAASLTLSLSSQPASQNIVAGGSGILFAQPQLDASASGEDVRISSIPLRIDSNTGLTNCQLWDGSTALNTGSNVPTTLVLVGAGKNNIQFDNTLVVTKGTVKTLALKCNTTSQATGSYTVTLNGGDAVSATGVTSGSSVAVTNAGSTGGTMTVQAGSLAVTVDASSPSYSLAAGGATGVTVGVVNLHATNEAVTLNKLGLTLSGATAAQLNTVSIYDGATLVGTATFTGNNTAATSTLLSPVTLPKDADKILTIKADLADIGSGQAGTDGALVQINPNSAEGSGQASGGTVKVGATGSVAGVRVYNTFPTVALDTLGSTGIVDGKLMRFKVTADSHDKVGIGQLAFKVATSSNVTVTNVQLFAFNDSGYSNAISGQGTSGQIGSTVSTITNGDTFTISPDLNAIQVPAGSTVYFELRGSVSVSGSSGGSAVTTLLGDGSGTPTTGTTQFDSVSGSFRWSPNATTTAATSTGNDWTNGYGVAGLPAGGLFQTRSQ
jgi:hypothetical protein